MEAEDGTSCDADTFFWDRAQHECAGREAGPINDDPLARLTDLREQPQIRANFTPWTRYNAELSVRHCNRGDRQRERHDGAWHGQILTRFHPSNSSSLRPPFVSASAPLR